MVYSSSGKRSYLHDLYHVRKEVRPRLTCLIGLYERIEYMYIYKNVT